MKTEMRLKYAHDCLRWTLAAAIALMIFCSEKLKWIESHVPLDEQKRIMAAGVGKALFWTISANSVAIGVAGFGFLFSIYSRKLLQIRSDIESDKAEKSEVRPLLKLEFVNKIAVLLTFGTAIMILFTIGSFKGTYLEPIALSGLSFVVMPAMIFFGLWILWKFNKALWKS